MRGFQSSLTVFAAALYVLLGISASWHAPHFMRGEASIGVDAHGEHETSLDGESCALCSTKNPVSRASIPSLRFAPARLVGLVPPRTAHIPVDEVFAAARARAPPALS